MRDLFHVNGTRILTPVLLAAGEAMATRRSVPAKCTLRLKSREI